MAFGLPLFARVSRIALISSLLSGSLLSGPFFYAQQPLPVGQPIAAAPADPAIAAALQQVSPDNIKAIIAKLVTFNNRSTISSMETDLAPRHRRQRRRRLDRVRVQPHLRRPAATASK